MPLNPFAEPYPAKRASPEAPPSWSPPISQPAAPVPAACPPSQFMPLVALPHPHPFFPQLRVDNFVGAYCSFYKSQASPLLYPPYQPGPAVEVYDASMGVHQVVVSRSSEWASPPLMNQPAVQKLQTVKAYCSVSKSSGRGKGTGPRSRAAPSSGKQGFGQFAAFSCSRGFRAASMWIPKPNKAVVHPFRRPTAVPAPNRVPRLPPRLRASRKASSAHSSPAAPAIAPQPFSISFDKNDPEGRTTVMLRNIPNKYSRSMLIDLLDHHCREENQKAAETAADRSEYDFVYLPIDFKLKGNLGYAFVNFTTSVGASRFFDAMNGHSWQFFRSRKICSVCFARIQGKQGLLDHFRSSLFFCENDEYLPAVFSPPRSGDGTTETDWPQLVTVGLRMASLLLGKPQKAGADPVIDNEQLKQPPPALAA